MGVRVKKTIQVVGAAVVRDGLVLCAQRGQTGSLPGMWEFPGGKIEPGESARDALIREIDEELKCSVLVGEEINTALHEYDFAVISLTTFFCELIAGEPTLTEHEAVAWMAPENLFDLNWAPADIPAVESIILKLSS